MFSFLFKNRDDSLKMIANLFQIIKNQEVQNTEAIKLNAEALTLCNETLLFIQEIKKENKKRKVKMVLTQYSNNLSKLIIMSFKLAANQKSAITVALVDATSLQPVTSTVADVKHSVDNGAVATVDAEGNLVGIAAGTAKLTSSASWTYIDTATKEPKTVELSIDTDIEVEAAIVTADAVTMQVDLAAPVLQ